MESKQANKEGAAIIIMDEAKLMEVFSRVLDEKQNKISQLAPPNKDPVPLDEYIPKSVIRGKILSSSTLWKHEQKGNLKTYAIGGKRFYKRSEIENLIQEVKQ